MPAAITHYYHAKRALEEAKPKQEIPEDAFLWGAQGPDFLFCHRGLLWKKGDSLAEYGEKLHQEPPAHIFTCLQEYCKLHHDAAIAAYCMGFLCHYAADCICHPFIYCQAERLLKIEPGQDLEIAHHQVESALDSIILRYEAASLPMEFNLKKALPKNPSVQRKIAELYAFLLERLYGISGKESLLIQAADDARAVFGWLNDRTSLKKSLVERWERRHGGKHTYSCHMRPVSEGDTFDYANVLLQDWSWPQHSEAVRKESFFDLYEQSVLDAQKLIADFLAGADPIVMTENIPFE
ncbi:zinc dependent phospholipase C family protein [Clostridium sp. D33t1_170424_F3]|uniref:zinc dependent phospholipase C family protein n=1 Tax=Clostridium sp. D33t1_170424_F3 TaxID=2787099 RepID=UPI0018AAA495|nr:zinc dependent phospholipase C family protein [Clostridium sp. D33t1_170424_F3]